MFGCKVSSRFFVITLGFHWLMFKVTIVLTVCRDDFSFSFFQHYWKLLLKMILTMWINSSDPLFFMSLV